MRNVRIALGQMRAVQGDTRANMKKMEAMAAGAAAGGADIICFPELSYTGYFVKKNSFFSKVPCIFLYPYNKSACLRR